jgi:hypothetical protein
MTLLERSQPDLVLFIVKHPLLTSQNLNSLNANGYTAFSWALCIGNQGLAMSIFNHPLFDAKFSFSCFLYDFDGISLPVFSFPCDFLVSFFFFL